MIKKLQNKLSEFGRSESKLAWVYDQWKWRYFTFRYKKQARLNVVFDHEHGVETATELPLHTAGVPLSDVARGNGVYRPLTESLFRASVASIGIDASKFIFLDIGSGKGKVLFMAADLPFKRVLGIEYAAGLHEIAVRNVTTYRSKTQRCRDILPIQADALEYQLPDGPLVLFIFNALAQDIMRGFLQRLDSGTGSHNANPIILIYTNVRSVAEAGDVFDELQNLRVIRRARNYLVIANEPGRALTA